MNLTDGILLWRAILNTLGDLCFVSTKYCRVQKL